MMYRGRSMRRVGLVCVMALAALVLLAQTCLAAGIRVVPSVERVLPGEDFYLDIIAENIPVDDGLGAVQFRLNVDAPGSKVAGVPDLGQATADSVSVATPLLISAPTSTRSGLGAFFGSSRQGSGGVLVMDNETLANGSALFTYAHTHGASRASGTGSVARFRVHVGTAVAAERIDFTLSEVLLLDGGPAYPLDSNVGATVTLRCTSIVPDLAGKTLAEAQSLLAVAGLTTGSVYEILNPNSAKPLGVVLAQSAPAGSELDCEAAVGLAINAAPAEVTGLAAADVAGDDTGKVALSWTSSVSSDTVGYRVYAGSALLAEVAGAPAVGTEIGGFENNVARTLRVTAYDTFGNESAGVTVTATALDDVPPQVAITGVEEGTFYNTPVTPQVEVVETNPASQTITLNGAAYAPGTPIGADGSYILAVSATDASVNTTSRSVSFTVDATAPAITIANITDGAFYKADIIPEIVVSDLNLDAAANAFTLNGQPYVPGTPVADEGAYTLSASARDRAGNEASLTVSFSLDKTAPVISLEGVADGAYYKTDVIPMVAVTDGALATSSLTLNGEPFVSGTPVTAEGEYTLVASASDRAGNASARTVSFTIDRTAPVILVSGVTEGAFYKTDVLPQIAVSDLNLDASQTVSTLNGASYVSGTAVSSEGAYTLTVTARDLAGNEASLTVSFTLDKTAPVIGVAGVVDGKHYNVDVAPAVSVTDAWLAESRVTLNGQPFVSGTALIAEGEYLLELSGLDQAGNQSVQAVRFVIDKTAPLISVSGVADGTHYNTDVAPAITVTDAYLKTSSVLLSEEAFVSGKALAQEGEYQLAVSAEDEAGNSASQTVSFVIDKTAPVISVAGVAEGALYNTDVTPAISISDAYLKTSSLTLNDQPFASGVAVSKEGAHVLSASAGDRAGNTAAAAVGFVIDKTAPTSAASVGTPRYAAGEQLYIAGGTQVALSSADGGVPTGVAAIEFALDQASLWESYQNPFALAALADGSHQILYRATDLAGNVENAQTLSVVLDQTPPASAITVGAPRYGANGALYVAGSTGCTLSTSDALSGVVATEYRLDGGVWTAYTPFTLAGLTDGVHVIGYRSSDHVENSEPEQTLTVTVDNAAPTTTITAGAPQFAGDGKLYVTSAATFTLAAADPLSGVAKTEYRLDGGQWQTYADAFTLIGLGDGEHVIGFRSTDHLGNVETEQTLAIVVDNTAPTTTVATGAQKHVGPDGTLYVTAATAFTLAAGDALSGVAATEYRIDDAAWVAYAPFTLAGLADGPHTIRYLSIDHLGNLEPEQTLSVTVDNTAPVTTITTGTSQYADADGKLYITDATVFTLSASDNLSGVKKMEYRLDGGPWQTYADAFTLTGLGNGEHVISFRSTDNVDNGEGEKSLTVIVDNAPPVTTITTGTPQATGADGTLYVTASTVFALSAADSFSGVAATEYRLDGGPWTAYAPFSIAGEGNHVIGFRSTDQLGNTETEKVLHITVDNSAPVTTIAGGETQFTASGTIYVAASTPLILSATDSLSGVATTEYRVDGGDRLAYSAPFTLAGLPDGTHTVAYRSTDRLGNVETAQALTVILDTTPPQTTVSFNHQSYLDGDTLLLSRQTEVVLTASDNLSGVQGTYYSFDDELAWRTYHGVFKLTDLAFGVHTVRFRSVDNVSNTEKEQTVTVTLVSIEVDSGFLNLPRVLVWTEDPAQLGGKQQPAYTLADVRSLVTEALGVPDVYATLVTDKDFFQQELRSGIYNMVMVLNQDVPFDTVFLREMREAVNRGMGLLVSSWGNSVPPLWQDLFGVDFKGSLAMSAQERPLILFQSPVSAEGTLTTSGKVLKVGLNGGTLAGLIPGESACGGMRGLTLRHPVEVRPGDRLTATLSVPQGKKLMTVDQEQTTVSTLPAGPVNRSVGNITGDLAIAAVAADGLTLSIVAPYGELAASYTLAVTVERADSSRLAAVPVTITPTCDAHLAAGMPLGPFTVTAIDEDRIKISDDLPAVVTSLYGKVKTVFLAYNLIESALHANRAEHLELLRNATSYLLPDAAGGPEAGGIALLETRLRLHGAGLTLLAADTLGEGLQHLPLFDLTQQPLEFTFNLNDGAEAAWRYFLRIPDAGEYGKTTAVSLGLEGGYALYVDYPTSFSVEDDSRALLLQALAWVEGKLPAHPEAANALRALHDELVRIDSLPRTTPAEVDQVIHEVVQAIHQALQLGFDASELRELLDDYLRIIEGEGYFLE